MEEARPSSIGEEEMQLQIALALSREACEKEDEERKGDAIRLQMALEESKKRGEQATVATTVSGAPLTQSALDDLLSLNLGEPAPVATNATPIAGPSGLGTSSDPWSPLVSTNAAGGQQHDPWSPVKTSNANPRTFFSIFSASNHRILQSSRFSAPTTRSRLALLPP